MNFGWGVGLVAWLGSVLWFDGMEMNKKSASPKKTLPPVGAIAAIVAIEAIEVIVGIEAMELWGKCCFLGKKGEIVICFP